MLYTGKILICRPKAQADKLAHTLVNLNRGWQPIVFPSIDIQPMDLKQKFIPLSSGFVQQADIILIQSPSVLTYLDQPSLGLLAQSKVIYAMGQGTQEALQSKNIKSCWVASHGAASEHILSQSPISELPLNSKILLLTGEGGRSVLEPELIKKGLTCFRVNTYKRVLPIYEDKYIKNILDKQPELIIVTSVDILKNLLLIFKNYLDMIIKLPILVISPRIQQAAIGLDWQGDIVLADSARSDDIIGAIERFYLL